MERPIFEVRDGKKHYKIFADGRTQGFGKGALVNNRIPHAIIGYWLAEREKIKVQKDERPT